MLLKEFWKIIKTAFKNWNSRDPFRESSVIAYSAIFSLPGLLVVVITLAGYFFGEELVSQHLQGTITDLMGYDTAKSVDEMIIAAMKSKESVWATILGVVTILVGATGVFVQLQKTFNIIWEVKAKTSKSGVWPFIRTRLFSFGLIISIAFLLLISLVLSAFLAAIGGWIKNNWSDGAMWLFEVLNFLFSFGLITLLFALMFKIMPDVKIPWSGVWVGAFVTSLLFVIGKTLLGFYFGTAEPGSGYGAAGSVILILLWTSYSSLIVFYGAEFTRAYIDRKIGYVPPSEIAVKEKGRVI